MLPSALMLILSPACTRMPVFLNDRWARFEPSTVTLFCAGFRGSAFALALLHVGELDQSGPKVPLVDFELLRRDFTKHGEVGGYDRVEPNPGLVGSRFFVVGPLLGLLLSVSFRIPPTCRLISGFSSAAKCCSSLCALRPMAARSLLACSRCSCRSQGSDKRFDLLGELGIAVEAGREAADAVDRHDEVAEWGFHVDFTHRQVATDHAAVEEVQPHVLGAEVASGVRGTSVAASSLVASAGLPASAVAGARRGCAAGTSHRRCERIGLGHEPIGQHAQQEYTQQGCNRRFRNRQFHSSPATAHATLSTPPRVISTTGSTEPRGAETVSKPTRAGPRTTRWSGIPAAAVNCCNWRISR